MQNQPKVSLFQIGLVILMVLLLVMVLVAGVTVYLLIKVVNTGDGLAVLPNASRGSSYLGQDNLSQEGAAVSVGGIHQDDSESIPSSVVPSGNSSGEGLSADDTSQETQDLFFRPEEPYHGPPFLLKLFLRQNRVVFRLVKSLKLR